MTKLWLPLSENPVCALCDHLCCGHCLPKPQGVLPIQPPTHPTESVTSFNKAPGTGKTAIDTAFKGSTLWNGYLRGK